MGGGRGKIQGVLGYQMIRCYWGKVFLNILRSVKVFVKKCFVILEKVQLYVFFLQVYSLYGLKCY